LRILRIIWFHYAFYCVGFCHVASNLIEDARSIFTNGYLWSLRITNRKADWRLLIVLNIIFGRTWEFTFLSVG
jgi:hypothetical protein